MSEGIQITIPDFEDDDYNSSTIPFGRSAGNQFGFGGGFGASTNGSGQDSPTLMTPTMDNRSYFSTHARGDSVTSVDSTSSVTARYPNRSQTSFVHSSHSSIAASNSSSFPKKSSFASLRNAFKSGKNMELPPVPSLDYQPNSVLKNAFNRSTSSLNNVSPMPTSAKGIPPAMSPQFGRPATPASAEPRYMRGLPSTRSKSHSYAKSYHSQSGSIFHISDTGSDGHGQFSSSPPPVPRFPNGMIRSETPDFEEDKVSSSGLQVLAEGKIDTFLRQFLEQEPLLTLFMGPGVDSAFDGILNSLGKIAQKHAKPVVDSVMRWRKSQVENVGSDIIRFHMAQSPPGTVRTVRTTDVPNLLNERKSLAAIYIMCRALIAVLQSLPKDGLGEALGYSLEKTTFEQFKKPDLKLLLQSANHRTNAELYATMLGHLANVRFVSITDRFLSELGPVAQGQVTKDDMKFENLVKGIKHVQLKVWPPEAFEEGAEFLESFAKSFAHAHGFKLKSAFAETLVQILHPIGKTAQAETNNPMWAKAIEIIYPKAREMMSKPRYWNVAFPLVITSLCVAPESYFKKHWISCFESSLSKLKLDNLLKHFFPPNRSTIFPQDDGVDPLIYITHFVLDLCLELLQESAINSTNLAGGNVANVLAFERMTIEASAPSWPSSSDFFSPVPPDDYGLSPALQDIFDRLAKFCSNAWIYTMSASYEEPHNLVVKRHPEGPQISTLAACFQTWPRFLHSSISITDAPILTDIASEAVRRFMADPVEALVDGIGNKLLVESVQLLSLWEEIVEKWVVDLMQSPRESYIKEEKLIWARCHELEAGVMFLLSHEAIGIHDTGAKIARLLSQLSQKLWPESSTHPDGLIADNSYFTGYDEFLDEVDIDRLRQWRESKRADKLLRVAEGKTDKDRKLWRFIYSTFMHTCADNAGPTLATFRDTVVFAASRYHSTVSHLAGLTGINTRVAAGQSRPPDGFRKVKDNKAVIDQWYLWVKILSSTATLPESSRPALTQLGRRAFASTRERLTTTRGLFRYLTPFLDSEYVAFRDAAVLCISSFPSSAYPQLLEDLSLLVGRQVYDDPRGKAGIAAAIEQNMGILAARSPNDTKIGVVFGDRSRRQERLHAAVARIYYLTAHYLPRQRSTGRQAALANVLKFVRNTQAFLGAPENRDSHSFHRLRTYFCGIVEKVFDGLSTLEGSDRFIPGNTHIALYRLCEEWCSLGPQPETVKQPSDLQSEDDNPVEAFKKASELLSYAAIGALASLCPKAFSPSGVSSGSPLERSTSENFKPLTATAVLDRLSSILASEHVPSQDRGNSVLLAESVRRAHAVAAFFQVIVDMIHDTDAHGFTFAQVVCLGLSNLCHQSIEYRRRAFSMLEAIHRQTSDLLSMSQLEATVESSASAMYTHAHALVSEFLAGAHPEEALNILSELGAWLPSIPKSSSTVILLLLQSLEFWISNIPLMTDDKIGLREHGHSALYHLLCLTLRYARSHTEQVMALWSKLVEPPHEANGHATVRFLVEQSHKVGSIVFCICQTAIGRTIYEDLCTVIEPVRVIPTIDHKLAFPTAGDMELWSDLDALFSDKQPRLSLGGAQFAWLFLADVALQRCWELQPQLPVLLHSILIHIDHRTPFVRLRAQYMLFQILRSWAPGYDELPERPPNGTRAAIKNAIKGIEAEAPMKYWREDETSQQCEPKMKWLCDRVLYILQPLCPGIREAWGTLALEWSTQCAFRHLAFRSLQTFRALMPRTSIGDLANLLGRLSLTIASPDDGVQSFASEILLTFNALAADENFNVSLFPQMFWCACAALSTTVEKEFSNALSFVSTLLTRVNLDDPSISELFLNHRPKDWIGSSGLQPALLAGLRSSTMTVFKDEGRVRDLYTVSLPWFLHAMSSDKGLIDEDLSRFAENIGELAKQEGRQSIGKIMSSFAKSHFRTRDDFLRQSVSSLREHYGATSWTQIVTLLLGLALNQERWLRIHAMQIVKVLFQQTRSPVERLGSEMLMPLLRLLETDLAPQALDVLEEPMTMMSMHARNLMKEDQSAAIVFGAPEDSGWCVAQADTVRETCRANMMGVFDTCSMPSRPSRIDFQPEEVEALVARKPTEEDLGGLVQNLHDLTTFFQDEPSRPAPMSVPNRRLEARVAAILAKSTAPEVISDVPPTPFVDVFRVSAMEGSDDDSNEFSDSDDEADAFIFDSPSVFHSVPNGSRYH
ncbi:cell morphogenesis N-terminal-domain-containing protein [Armillaria luteobubalina]|uniref:Cell morphogenesis N-terminal-domain-containing protein n=1 Tax=Armillaria luteobubalina TaxID=153913 RepID=A0AA39Q4W1_9AGAR|nr:cell morphogenesis N-terminal-domain-containing protein [Armillaria luteobubalina]